MNASEPLKILIVDDHPALRVGLSAIVNAQDDFTVVAEAGTAQEAVSACEAHRPSVTLMDLRIPGGGVSATTTIRQRYPDTRVLIVTTYETDEDIYSAMQAGASGYVLKGLTSAQLTTAIRTVHAGQRYLSPNVAKRLRERECRKILSPREVEVIRHVIAGHSNKEIAQTMAIGEESVKTHLKGIFIKLGAADRTQAAIEAVRQGIVQL